MRKCLLAVALTATLAACATTQTVWAKPGASTQDFYQDRGQCQAQAFSLHPNASLMQVAVVFNGCMQGRGWYEVEEPIRR